MADPEARSDHSMGMQASSPDPVGIIGKLVTDNVPALRPDHRAFVVVNGVLAALLLGVLLFSKDIATAKWAMFGTLLLFALNSVLVYLLSRSRQRKHKVDDYDRRRTAAESVNGLWWQIILVSGDEGEILVEGLTIVDIRLRVDGGSYGLGGELFDDRGKSRAQWRAEAVAIKALAPVELFYRFSGYSFRGPVLNDPTGDVTGIGTFTFDDTGPARAAEQGAGWFATGHVEKLQFGRRRDVRLIRISQRDRETLDGPADDVDSRGREQLIADRYRHLASRYGSTVDHRSD